jgi:hypothetical protein
VEYQDLEGMIKSFDVKDREIKLENGLLGAIYSKLALKNL